MFIPSEEKKWKYLAVIISIMNLKQIDLLIASLTASKVASILENTLEKILFRKHWYNYFPFFTKEKVEYSFKS